MKKHIFKTLRDLYNLRFILITEWPSGIVDLLLELAQIRGCIDAHPASFAVIEDGWGWLGSVDKIVENEKLSQREQESGNRHKSIHETPCLAACCNLSRSLESQWATWIQVGFAVYHPKSSVLAPNDQLIQVFSGVWINQQARIGQDHENLTLDIR